MKDPDGFVFEMEQFFPEGPTSVPADSKVLTAGLGMSISNGEKSIAFYKALGFTTRLGASFSAPSSDVGMALLGTEGAQLRASSVGVPEGRLQLFCFELHGVEGAAPHHKPQDPGAGGFILQMRDDEAAIAAVKANGGSILTTGGKPITRKDAAGSSRVVLVSDPDGMLLELVEPAK
jgi:predicted enzyme related to lactoylglutathione lyase